MTEGFVLDTNLVSELARPRPDGSVEQWLLGRTLDCLFLTATIVGELWRGIEARAPGRRRRELEGWLGDILERQFAGRILAYDAGAARRWASLMQTCRELGRPAAALDAQIAAVALTHGLAVATRNVRDFEAFGVALVDPWSQTNA
jgi:toxin FitB